MPEYPRPPWYWDVKKALVDQDLTVTRLADELGVSRVYVSQVINGKSQSKVLENRILKRLGITA